MYHYFSHFIILWYILTFARSGCIRKKKKIFFYDTFIPLRRPERLFETKISQKVGEQKSFFKLENENGFSSFNVNCSDNKNIDIEIFHNIKDMELLADKICLNSNEINEEQIENILNSFIKEFQSYTKC